MTESISPTGYEAIYKVKWGDARRPVQSWSAEGAPQVVHENRLVDAYSIVGFREVRSCLSVAGVVPGGDWIEEWCLSQEKNAPQAVWPIPVISWIVTSDGDARAVIPQELWPEKDYNGQEIDWDGHGMSSVRTMRSTDFTLGWRRYRGPDTESEPWPT